MKFKVTVLFGSCRNIFGSCRNIELMCDLCLVFLRTGLIREEQPTRVTCTRCVGKYLEKFIIFQMKNFFVFCFKSLNLIGSLIVVYCAIILISKAEAR